MGTNPQHGETPTPPGTWLWSALPFSFPRHLGPSFVSLVLGLSPFSSPFLEPVMASCSRRCVLADAGVIASFSSAMPGLVSLNLAPSWPTGVCIWGSGESQNCFVFSGILVLSPTVHPPKLEDPGLHWAYLSWHLFQEASPDLSSALSQRKLIMIIIVPCSITPE